MPADIKYYQLFGGEKVIFEKEEVTDMKKFGTPGIYIFTYSNSKLLLFWCYIRGFLPHPYIGLPIHKLAKFKM